MDSPALTWQTGKIKQLCTHKAIRIANLGKLVIRNFSDLRITELRMWCIVFVLCVGSRTLTTIFYIEDLDSLRFALSMADYNVAKLQPHFPAYPVFCFFGKLFFAVTGRFALAFLSSAAYQYF